MQTNEVFILETVERENGQVGVQICDHPLYSYWSGWHASVDDAVEAWCKAYLSNYGGAQ